jgi:hypothetical protein
MWFPRQSGASYHTNKINYYMMKTSVIVLLIMFCCILKAQQVVATSGNQFSNDNGSIAFTIGEGVANTFTNGEKTLTQGFHQTIISVSIVSPPEETDFSMTAYPNPATETLTLTTDYENIPGLKYLLIDQSGKLLLKKEIESAVTVIPIEQLLEGIYIIKIQDNLKELKSFKIIKQ